MMIDDDHVEAEPLGLRKRRMAHRAAVERDEEARAFAGECRDGLDIRAIAFGQAIGNVKESGQPRSVR